MRAIVMKGMCLGAVVVLMGVSLHASAVTQPGVPEIGPGSISAGLALLAGGVLMLRARRSK
jgi:hypothetical protein